MPFKRGDVGNPAGGRAQKAWRTGIITALTRETGMSRDEAIAHAATMLVKNALTGDNVALKEIGDRLDGKPTQEVEQTSVVMTYEEKLKLIADDLGIRETDTAPVQEQLH